MLPHSNCTVSTVTPAQQRPGIVDQIDPPAAIREGFHGVAWCIAETVFGYIEDPCLGDELIGEPGRTCVDIARLVEFLDGQITRDEIIVALDRLVAERRIELLHGDGGITAVVCADLAVAR